MSVSELTPGEKAYMESGGTDAAALLAENPAVTPAEPVAPAPAVEKPSAAEVPVASAAEAPAAVAPEAPEAGEEEIPAADGKTKRRVVDSRALKAEREARKAAEAELTRYRENYTRVDERLKMLSEVVSQPDAPAAPEPDEAPIDPEQDIFGAYRQLQKQLEQIKSSTTEMRTQTETERQTNALVSTYRQDAAAFRQATPDFNDAYNFLLDKRGQQLKALGYGDAEIATALYNEEINLASRALSMRQSPSQQLYALAQSMGYAKAAPVAPAAQAAPATTAVPAAPVAAAPSVTAEIEAIKAGQNTSRSLSSGGGAAGEELSLEALANMPDKEFAKFMEKPGNRERVEIAMGRRAA